MAMPPDEKTALAGRDPEAIPKNDHKGTAPVMMSVMMAFQLISAYFKEAPKERSSFNFSSGTPGS